MKAVVMEITGRYMVVLDRSGCFHRLKYDHSSCVGSEIEMPIVNKRPIALVKKLTAAAAILLFALCSGYGAVSYYTPYAYVGIDINPSVELVLNRYLRVIDIQSLNEDGAKVVAGTLKIKNETMDNAVGMLLENAEKQAFIAEGKSNVVVYTVSGIEDNPLENIRGRLKNTTRTKLNKLIAEEDIIAEKITQKKRNDARSLKTSPGRLILFEKLKEVNPDARLEDIESRPVRETVREIREYKEKEREIEKNPKKTNDRIKDKQDKPDPAKETLQDKVREIKEEVQKEKKDRDNIRDSGPDAMMPVRPERDSPNTRQDSDSKRPVRKAPVTESNSIKENQHEPGKNPDENLHQETQDRDRPVPQLRNQVPEVQPGNQPNGTGRGGR